MPFRSLFLSLHMSYRIYINQKTQGRSQLSGAMQHRAMATRTQLCPRTQSSFRGIVLVMHHGTVRHITTSHGGASNPHLAGITEL